MPIFKFQNQKIQLGYKIEVQEFIDVGEYGLALDTLVDIVDEEGKQVPLEVLSLVCELAEVMLLDKSVFEEKLRSHVVES